MQSILRYISLALWGTRQATLTTHGVNAVSQTNLIVVRGLLRLLSFKVTKGNFGWEIRGGGELMPQELTFYLAVYHQEQGIFEFHARPLWHQRLLVWVLSAFFSYIISEDCLLWSKSIWKVYKFEALTLKFVISLHKQWYFLDVKTRYTEPSE